MLLKTISAQARATSQGVAVTGSGPKIGRWMGLFVTAGEITSASNAMAATSSIVSDELMTMYQTKKCRAFAGKRGSRSRSVCQMFFIAPQASRVLLGETRSQKAGHDATHGRYVGVRTQRGRRLMRVLLVAPHVRRV